MLIDDEKVRMVKEDIKHEKGSIWEREYIHSSAPYKGLRSVESRLSATINKRCC